MIQQSGLKQALIHVEQRIPHNLLSPLQHGFAAADHCLFQDYGEAPFCSQDLDGFDRGGSFTHQTLQLGVFKTKRCQAASHLFGLRCHLPRVNARIHF